MKHLLPIIFFLFGLVTVQAALTITPAAGEYLKDGVTSYYYDVTKEGYESPSSVMTNTETFISKATGQSTTEIVTYSITVTSGSYRINNVTFGTGNIKLTAGATVTWSVSGVWKGTRSDGTNGSKTNLTATDGGTWGTVPFPPEKDDTPPGITISSGLVPGQVYNEAGLYQYNLKIEGAYFKDPDTGREVKRKVEIRSPAGIVQWASTWGSDYQGVLPLVAGSEVWVLEQDSKTDYMIHEADTGMRLGGIAKPVDPDPTDPGDGGNPATPVDPPDPEGPDDGSGGTGGDGGGTGGDGTDPDPNPGDGTNPGGGTGGNGNGSNDKTDLSGVIAAINAVGDKVGELLTGFTDFVGEILGLKEKVPSTEEQQQAKVNEGIAKGAEAANVAKGYNFMGRELEITGSGTIQTDGTAAYNPWAIVIAEKTFDLNPLNTVKDWAWLKWARGSATIIITFLLVVGLFKSFKEIHTLLQIQSEVHGQTWIIATFLGSLGVHSTFLAGFLKVLSYFVGAVLLTGVIWSVGMAWGVTPSISRSLMADGIPAFAYEFANKFFPVDYFATAPVIMLGMKFSIFSFGLLHSHIKKGNSIA